VFDRGAVDVRGEGADDDEAGDDQGEEEDEDQDKETAHSDCRGAPVFSCAARVAQPRGAVLALPTMSRNSALNPGGAEAAGSFRAPHVPACLDGRSLVLVGLPGAGKTSIGRRLALRLGLPFRDADAEIEKAAGCTVTELFARFGEPAFRDGERRVIKRLLAGPAIVLATGGGAFMDPETRAEVRALGVSVWLRASLPTLMRRISGRTHRPLLSKGDPEQILRNLMAVRHPVYAEADIVVQCGEDSPEATTGRVMEALHRHAPPRRVEVKLGSRGYDVLVGPGLLTRAGALLASVLPQKRAVIVADETVAALHLPALVAGLSEAGFETRHVTVSPGEASKSLAVYGHVSDALLEAGVERRTAVIALGGGVVGDLAGFAAATVLRGLPFVQVPTTLLAQVDSSVGGKTGINTAFGKNLLGAFWQPRMVLADTATLATLPARELRAGYAEIIKAGLIGDAAFFAWCEANGAALLAGDSARQAEAVARSCAFKAAVVGDDELEEKASDGRALLNLGHTFGHALEAEFGYTGELLHGEAVSVGLVLAFRLSVALDVCAREDADRVQAHVEAVGLPAEIGALGRRFSGARLIRSMQRDKKMRDGKLAFVLARGIGAAFTSREVPAEAVAAVLRAQGCEE
jgi:shikimate kinase/3-dehydroquinate synthase